MKDFILTAPETTDAVAICNGDRYAKITFTANNGKTYTHINHTGWLQYCEGRIPIKIQYSMQNGEPDIWIVMSKMD